MLALSRLRKELGSAMLPVTAVIWQQGEADANHSEMTDTNYKMLFFEVASDLRANGVFAPIFVARTTLCEVNEHPFNNHEAIRNAQASLPDAQGGIIAGPDIDTIGVDARYDRCHFSKIGLDRCSDLWFETLSAQSALLRKP